MEPIKCNDRVMLAVFKRFIENPQLFSPNDAGGAIISSYVPYEECAEPDPGYSEPEWHALLRWHVSVLATEFLIDESISRISITCAPAKPTFANLTGVGVSSQPINLKDPMNCLNWSGQQLYKRLEEDKNNKQQ